MILLLAVSAFTLHSQTIHEGKKGSELLELLVQDYKPFTELFYGMARDTMYKRGYRDSEGFVHCGYTDYKVFLPLDVDPSSYLFEIDYPFAITAEHIYPQSKGANIII